MELTNEETARVFAMYLGSKGVVKRATYYMVHERNYHVGDKFILHGWLIDYLEQTNAEVQLLLTSIGDITDEHAIEVSGMLGLNYQLEENNIHWVKEFLSSLFRPISNYRPFDAFSVIKYLISKSYAVPLWFGLNHWANGKTGIELGIAIPNIKTQSND